MDRFFMRAFDCPMEFAKFGLAFVFGSAVLWGCTRPTDKPESNETSLSAALPAARQSERGDGEDIDQREPVASAEALTTPEGTGVIEGTVRFSGTAVPTSTMIPIAADMEYCGPEHSKEDYVIDAESRGVRYTIVHLKGEGVRDWLDVEPGYLMLDNKNCRFEPHAAVLTVGSTLELHNSDSIYHTTHAYFGASFNFALPEKDARVKVVLDTPGLIQIRCDKHGWMNAFIHVGRHPLHAVTDSQGRFNISGVPAGRYTLSAWHEQFGRQQTPVVVRAGETTRQELTYAIRSKKPLSH